MPNAVFMGNPDKIKAVYAPAVTEALAKEAGLDASRVLSKEDVLAGAHTRDTEYIFSTWGMATLSEEEIAEHFPRLKAVFYAAGTVQYFARPFLARGVRVFSAWDANAVPVAEYTAAQIVLAGKGFYACARAFHGDVAGRKKALAHFHAHRGNYGASVGIVGAGMIGKMVIERLKAYNLRVKVYDPFLADEKAKALGVEKTTLEDVFASCEVVSNHVANLPATVGMMKGEHFASMKPYAVFLNTGRGAQIVEKEMTDVLAARPDLTAVLDVTDPEPPLADSPLYTLENVFLTPHIAGSAGDEVTRMAEYMLDAFRRTQKGDTVRDEVTLPMLETMA